MAMSSGKSSSSMAAVLLLVAVVACTCASGAQAELDITNSCSKTVIIATATSGATSLIFGRLHVPGLPNAFFIDRPCHIYTIRGIRTVTVTLGMITMDWLKQRGDRLHKIEIRCDANNNNCITLYVTYVHAPAESGDEYDHFTGSLLPLGSE